MSSRLCALKHSGKQVAGVVPRIRHAWWIVLPFVVGAVGWGSVQPAIATTPTAAERAQTTPDPLLIGTVTAPSYDDLLSPKFRDPQPHVTPLDATPPQAPSPQPPKPPKPQQSEQRKQLVVSLSTRQVTLYQGKQKVVSYPVAIGRGDWQTPTGQFRILEMTKNPVWEHPWNGTLVPPGPNNPLGDRWIAFWTNGTNYIGFHGTTDESLIGQAVSHGCIRMKNRDVRLLFEQVTVGTPVIVKP